MYVHEYGKTARGLKKVRRGDWISRGVLGACERGPKTGRKRFLTSSERLDRTTPAVSSEWWALFDVNVLVMALRSINSGSLGLLRGSICRAWACRPAKGAACWRETDYVPTSRKV